MACVNVNSPEFQNLLEDTGMNQHILAAKVTVWQEINGFENFPSLADLGIGASSFSSKNINIKLGVQELFESNPELANQVYEALGFDSNEFSLVLKQEVESPEGIMLGEYNIVHKNNIIGNVFLPIGFKNYTIKGISFKEQYLNKGLGKAFYKWLGNKADIENATLHSDFDNTSESAKRVWESLKKENLAVDTQMGYKFSPKNLKQQALEAYSQYLDTIFPDSQVKDIVYHGSDNNKLESFKENLRSGIHFGTIQQAKGRRIATDTEFKKDFKFLPVLLNLKNPLKSKDFDWEKAGDAFVIDWTPDTDLSDVDFTQYLLDNKIATEKDIQNSEGDFDIINKKGYDGVIYKNEGAGENTGENSFAVSKPEQIHILGSKQDIEGFKSFANRSLNNTNQLTNIAEDNFADWSSETNESEDPFLC